MTILRFRLRALCAAGGLLFILTPPLHAQENAPSASPNTPHIDGQADAEGARRVIEALPPPPTPTETTPPATAPPATAPPATAPSATAPSATIPVAPIAPPLPVASAPTSPNETLRAAITRLKLPLPLPQARIVVTKSRRALELFNGDTLVKTYRTALGSNPMGHKQALGDGRTPEGQFFICTRNAKDSAFHIFLGLSYPALPDATRGVNSKMISWREYQVIRQRLASRGAPLWGTRLGGWVGIHGGSGGKFAQRKSKERGSADWTAGCIALTDAEIKEIYAATKLGTPVLVRP